MYFGFKCVNEDIETKYLKYSLDSSYIYLSGCRTSKYLIPSTDYCMILYNEMCPMWTNDLNYTFYIVANEIFVLCFVYLSA